MSNKFRKTTIEDTELEFWQERDRTHVELRRKSNQKTMVEWWDEAVAEAVEDGFLDWNEAVLGNMSRFVKQYGALHQSAFDYWERYIKKTRKPKKALVA